MNARVAARGAAFGLVVLFTLPFPARGDRPLSSDAQEESKLAEDLQGLVRKLREARAAFYQRHRTRLEQLEAARSPVRRLEIELSDLRAQDAKLDRSLAEARGGLEKLRREEASDRRRAELGPELEKSLREAREFIDRGIPYRVPDRAGRLGAAGDGSLSDQIGRYWSFLQEEVRVARSGEALSMEVPLSGGRAKPARVFRVGHLVMGFVTEDGQEAGLWNGQQWVPASDLLEEKTIREAIEILDRRRTPMLLTLPVLRRGAP